MCDLNGDGDVDGIDFIIFDLLWGNDLNPTLLRRVWRIILTISAMALLAAIVSWLAMMRVA